MSIKLDRVLIITPIEEVGDTERLTPAPKGYINGKPSRWVASNKEQLPYQLQLSVAQHGIIDGQITPELKIEFSAKILKGEYPDLINSDNIQRCLEEVRNTGLYNFDVKRVITQGLVYSMDATEDLRMELTKQERIDLEVLVKRPTGWKFLSRSDNFAIARKNNEESISMYDKENEWNRAINREYRNTNNLNGAFDGIRRIEHKLLSAEMIRSRMDINNTRLETVLNSRNSPTVTLIKEAFHWQPSTENFITTKQKEAEMLAYIKQFEEADGTVEWKKMLDDIRLRNNNASSATRTRKKYKDFYKSLKDVNGKGLPGQIILNEIINDLELRIAA